MALRESNWQNSRHVRVLFALACLLRRCLPISPMHEDVLPLFKVEIHISHSLSLSLSLSFPFVCPKSQVHLRFARKGELAIAVSLSARLVNAAVTLWIGCVCVPVSTCGGNWLDLEIGIHFYRMDLHFNGYSMLRGLTGLELHLEFKDTTGKKN